MRIGLISILQKGFFCFGHLLPLPQVLDAYTTVDHPVSHSLARPTPFLRESLYAPIPFLYRIPTTRASSLRPPARPPRSPLIRPFARTTTLFPPRSVLSNASHLLVLPLSTRPPRSLPTQIRSLERISSTRASSLHPPASISSHPDPFCRTHLIYSCFLSPPARLDLFPPRSVLSNVSHPLVLTLYSLDSTSSPVLISRFSICHPCDWALFHHNGPWRFKSAFVLCAIHCQFRLPINTFPHTFFPYVLFIPTNYVRNEETRLNAREGGDTHRTRRDGSAEK